MTARASSVDEVLDLYRRWGEDRYDEALSQLDHGLQTAARAEASGAGDELVAAALLHDVGHLLALQATSGAGPSGDGPSGDGDRHHEAVGARYLAGLFGAEVTGPIALHVQAKRYRCAVDPGYHDGLSAGSRASLRRQGGPFDPAEAARFAARPGAEAAVALRAWDDEGKVEGLVVAPLEHHRPRLEGLARPR